MGSEDFRWKLDKDKTKFITKSVESTAKLIWFRTKDEVTHKTENTHKVENTETQQIHHLTH